MIEGGQPDVSVVSSEDVVRADRLKLSNPPSSFCASRPSHGECHFEMSLGHQVSLQIRRANVSVAKLTVPAIGAARDNESLLKLVRCHEEMANTHAHTHTRTLFCFFDDAQVLSPAQLC